MTHFYGRGAGTAALSGQRAGERRTECVLTLACLHRLYQLPTVTCTVAIQLKLQPVLCTYYVHTRYTAKEHCSYIGLCCLYERGAYIVYAMFMYKPVVAASS